MKAHRARRLAAVSAIGVLMASGVAIGTAGTASAATPTQVSTNRGCWWNNCYYGGFNNGFNNGFFGFNNGFNNVPVVVVVVS
ncbi:hypothetical protein AQI88_06050 [Streptomyces cellostaticus]|uniref:Uncharacterized protein n=1 Tax=Streptomyces cellostaticus TaxID=67285 RepID=A0A101NR96_9ACTN|nr:hypothetical protein [Streptomyces cellostaticus]KUM97784.1 hypothetical protein AQI88_06050 [Streptomyces cellostaticus]GHI08253.1 hypothetical protein Scel_65740 [Streptomyces cellostaticus]